MAIFTCLGNLDDDHLEDLREFAESGEAVAWTINSRAEPGDEALFYIVSPLSSLVARGTVATRPERESDLGDDWYGYYMADIAEIEMLDEPVHIRDLRAAFPEWGWLKSPIQSTRVPDDVVARLGQMLGGSRSHPSRP